MSENEDKLDAIRKKAAIEAAKKKSAEKRYQEKRKKESMNLSSPKVIKQILFNRLTLTILSSILLVVLILDPGGQTNPKNGQASARSASAQEWYQGGTLHGSTLAQWLDGSYRDKLATAADWIVTRLGDNQVRNMSRFKNRAETLVYCVDSTSQKVLASESKKNTERVGGLVSVCLAALEQNNWR